MLHINKFLILYKFIMLKKIFNSEIKEIINCLTKIKRSKNKSFKNLCVDAKTSLDNGGKIMFCGNGGSASDAQHLAAELVVKYQKKRKPLAAISLSTDTSVLTATGNDFGFQQIFSNIVSKVGSQVKSGKLNVEAAEAMREASEEAEAQFSGVNLDSQAAALIEFQQAYQASSRILQTARELFQTLMDTV